MEQEEVIRGKESDETGNVLVPASPPPKLNLRRLESIQRLLQYASVVVLAVFIILIAVSYFKLSSLNELSDNKRKELTNTQKELTDTQFRTELESNRLSNLQKEYSALEKASNLLLEKASNSLTSKQKEEVKRTYEEKLKQEDNSKQAPVWIYIQIADDKQRNAANDIARQLKSKGFNVPGIENVGDRAPNNSQLRTCGKMDDPITKRDLNELTVTLNRLKVNLGEPNFLSNCGKANSRQYELWFGNNF